MEIKLKYNTFIRKFDECVFIYNSETAEELIVDPSGGVFVSQITREWKSLSDVTNNMLKIFTNANQEEITNDAVEFFLYLQEKGFVDIKNNSINFQDIKTKKRGL